MASSSSTDAPQPVAVVCVGMAGSGKTTFMQRINSHLHSQRKPPYILNLDPAVQNVPFNTNIDIRDTVNYKEVMKQYNLGPNGGILTSLNLFATKIDQILGILEKRTKPTETPAPDLLASQKGEASRSQQGPAPIEHILVDTPGQIEVFVWSASGDILLNTLASSFPTVIAYVIDTPRTHSTSTFMSNMLYACSILYKTKLPMILVFNKTDVQDAEFAKEWMTDFEAFQAALHNEEEEGVFGGEGGGAGIGGSGYMSSLLNSMSLVLEEFYNNLSVVGVSSMTGAGVNDFFDAVKEKAEEFERDYKPELERRRAERVKQKEEDRQKQLGKLMKDMAVGEGSKKKSSGKPKQEPETISDLEDEDEEDDRYADDDDESDEDMESGDGGLKSRYQQALNDHGNPADEDFSFARYVHKASMG